MDRHRQPSCRLQWLQHPPWHRMCQQWLCTAPAVPSAIRLASTLPVCHLRHMYALASTHGVLHRTCILLYMLSTNANVQPDPCCVCLKRWEPLGQHCAASRGRKGRLLSPPSRPAMATQRALLVRIVSVCEHFSIDLHTPAIHGPHAQRLPFRHERHPDGPTEPECQCTQPAPTCREPLRICRPWRVAAPCSAASAACWRMQHGRQCRCAMVSNLLHVVLMMSSWQICKQARSVRNRVSRLSKIVL